MVGDPDRVSLADAIAALRGEIRIAAVRAQSLAPSERYSNWLHQFEINERKMVRPIDLLPNFTATGRFARSVSDSVEPGVGQGMRHSPP